MKLRKAETLLDRQTVETRLVPLTAGTIRKFQPHPEPIRLHDSVHLARSRAEKKSKMISVSKEQEEERSQRDPEDHAIDYVASSCLKPRQALANSVLMFAVQDGGRESFALQGL